MRQKISNSLSGDCVPLKRIRYSIVLHRRHPGGDMIMHGGKTAAKLRRYDDSRLFAVDRRTVRELSRDLVTGRRKITVVISHSSSHGGGLFNGR